jgi:hypothetical protein
MPATSQAQRRLMFAAAAKKGGAGGVPQSVGKEFAEADPGGKLPEKKGEPEGRADRRYAKSKHAKRSSRDA